MIRLIALLMLLAAPLRAEEVVLGLSHDEVSITATFDGSDILIFGAVKRESPIPGSDLDVIVTVSGPARPVTIRRKGRKGPIWANADALHLATAPAFYAVASNKPLAAIISHETDTALRISPRATITGLAKPMGVADPEPFIDALIRLRSESALYQALPLGVSISEQTLFRAQIALPADLTEGFYRARILLMRDGALIDEAFSTIPVRKVGIERLLYRMAQDHPWRYGFLALAIAVLAGWLASQIFALFKR